MNADLIKRTKELFKKLFSVPYATLSLIKKQFRWFKNTSEGWETLLDELIELSTENDVEVVGSAYKVGIQSNFPIWKIFLFSARTQRMEWIGNLTKNFNGTTTVYANRFARHGIEVSSFENGVRALISRAEKEQLARESILAS